MLIPAGANVQLCKDLGADEVINYREHSAASVLSSSTKPYDFVLDNIGIPFELYWKSPSYTKPGAKYVQIGSEVSLSFMYDIGFRFVVPKWLGGGQRPFSFGIASTNFNDFTGLARLVAEGKVKPVVDEVFAMKDVPRAYEKLKKGRARGKIVVRVRED
jgi:NADPH:quinone reductase-like Zn-dependent oxidoreductase